MENFIFCAILTFQKVFSSQTFVITFKNSKGFSSICPWHPTRMLQIPYNKSNFITLFTKFIPIWEVSSGGVLYKKGVLKDFTKLTVKHLRPEACNFIKKETLAKVFSCEFCEIFKNSIFTEHFQATASAIWTII